jgi:cell division topological specificity factor
MNLLSFFTRSRGGSADTAKERLQILLAHERMDRSGPDFLPKLKNDIIEVIRKYVPHAGDKVDVKLERGASVSTLEIDIELPGPQTKSQHVGRATSPAFAR